MISLLNKYRQWRTQRILDNSTFKQADWHRVADGLAVLDRLDETQKDRLYELATLFLHFKELTGAQGFELTDAARQSIALQACLPILNLGLEWYEGWSTVIVYPDTFRREEVSVDEFGVAHTSMVNLSGEAWLHGPVVLAWSNVEHADRRDGQNVVIHEFVHKLDMLNGRANGFPPMQKDMSPKRWAELMSAAFKDFQLNPKDGLDRYGSTNPAEFFAVLSEVFFETPDRLSDAYPEIYQLMTQFFLQRPGGLNS